MDYNRVLINVYKNLTKPDFTVGNLLVVNILSFYNKTDYLLNSSKKKYERNQTETIVYIKFKTK